MPRHVHRSQACRHATTSGMTVLRHSKVFCPHTQHTQIAPLALDQVVRKVKQADAWPQSCPVSIDGASKTLQTQHSGLDIDSR